VHGVRVLVTGASGFLGSHLIVRLAAAGASVVAVSRSGRPGWLAPAGVEWRGVDLEDPGEVRRLVREDAPERIFHLASRVQGARDRQLVLPMLRSNLAATVALLDAASEHGARRIVLAGSMEEPDPGSVEPPSSPYAASKAAAGLYARLYRALYGLPVVTARIFMAYGPAQRDLTKLVPYVILRNLSGEPARLSSGARAVDWIFAEDVVAGLVRLGEAEGIDGERLDLGTGRATSVAEVAAQICRLMSAPPPELGALPDRPLETVRVAQVEATERRIGFRPRVGLAEGLARTIEWYTRARAQGSL
jgi:UDP-glucose 4-epimerase